MVDWGPPRYIPVAKAAAGQVDAYQVRFRCAYSRPHKQGASSCCADLENGARLEISNDLEQLIDLRVVLVGTNQTPKGLIGELDQLIQILKFGLLLRPR
jgi:hypothetical protein